MSSFTKIVKKYITVGNGEENNVLIKQTERKNVRKILYKLSTDTV